MSKNNSLKKRPCRICRKWFAPNPRVGSRQMTCGSEECKNKWHKKKCSDWNRQNQQYFKNNYLGKKLKAVSPHEETPQKLPLTLSKSSKSPKLPQEVIQEVIGPQHLVIIEYVTQLLLRRFQEVMRQQRAEITEETERLPPNYCSRGDSQMRPS